MADIAVCIDCKFCGSYVNLLVSLTASIGIKKNVDGKRQALTMKAAEAIPEQDNRMIILHPLFHSSDCDTVENNSENNLFEYVISPGNDKFDDSNEPEDDSFFQPNIFEQLRILASAEIILFEKGAP